MNKIYHDGNMFENRWTFAVTVFKVSLTCPIIPLPNNPLSKTLPVAVTQLRTPPTKLFLLVMCARILLTRPNKSATTLSFILFSCTTLDPNECFRRTEQFDTFYSAIDTIYTKFESWLKMSSGHGLCMWIFINIV